MQFTLKTQAVIGLASALAVALIAGAVFLLPRGGNYGPADLVPADRTLLYVEHADAALRERFGPLVPFLNGLPQDAAGAAALIRRDDGTTDWVVFGAQIRAGHPATLALIGTGARLSDDPAFRAHLRGRGGTGAWMFVRNAQNDVALPDGLRQPHGPVSGGVHASETRVAWTNGGMDRPLNTGFKDLGDDLILRVQAGDLRAFLARAAAALSDVRVLAYEAALRARFAETFGSDLSLAYDLAPLLEGNTTLTLVRTGSGADAVLEGSARGAEERISRMLEAFRAGDGGADRVQRTFDEQFDAHTIRTGSDTTETTEELDGWTVRDATRGDAGFHAALKGDRFILSTDATLLRRAVDALPAPLENVDGVSVARGELVRQEALSALRRRLPGEGLPLPESLLSGPLLRWELVHTGDLTVLRLF